jgi:RNA polymerase sigma-70 factor, ECF subfamily
MKGNGCLLRSQDKDCRLLSTSGKLLEAPAFHLALEPPAPSTESDEELLRHFRATGRDADFAELVRRYSRPLRFYLIRYLGDSDLADDLVQSTFLHVLDRCGQYRDGRRVRPWLYAIANHQAIDALRHRRRNPSLSCRAGNLPDADPGAMLLGKEERQWLRTSLERLPDSLRSPLLLAYEAGNSYREIAVILHIPVTTVKSRLHEAITKLRAMARAAHLVERG